jgi:hypothetical protein
LGIGNPLFDGAQDNPVWGDNYMQTAEFARTKRCTQTSRPLQISSAGEPSSVRSFPSMFRGKKGQFAATRRCLRPLTSYARFRGGWACLTARSSLATEGGRLADYAMVHFATHGALSRQVEGTTEPGLILTPPPKGTNDP